MKYIISILGVIIAFLTLVFSLYQEYNKSDDEFQSTQSIGTDLTEGNNSPVIHSNGGDVNVTYDNDKKDIEKTKENLPEYYGLYVRLLSGELIELPSVSSSVSRISISGSSVFSSDMSYRYLMETPKITLDMRNVDAFILYGDEKNVKPNIYYIGKMSQQPKAFFGSNTGKATKQNSFLLLKFSCNEDNGMKRKKIKNGMYVFKYPESGKTDYNNCDLKKDKKVNSDYLQMEINVDFYGWWYNEKLWIFSAKNENYTEKEEKQRRIKKQIDKEKEKNHKELIDSLPESLIKIKGEWVGKNSSNYNNPYSLILNENKVYLVFDYRSDFGASSSYLTRTCKNEFEYKYTKDNKITFEIYKSTGCKLSKYIMLTIVDDRSLTLTTDRTNISPLALTLKPTE